MGHILRQIVKTATTATLPALKEQQIKIGKFNINYTKVGHGPHNVVMIAGALGSFRSHFRYQINGFNKEKFTLVLFDPHGYGKSVPPERTLTKESYQIDADTAYGLMELLNPDIGHYNADVLLNGEPVDPVDSTVFLGITIDSKLQWGPHIDGLAYRLSSAAFAVKKIRSLTDVDTARLVYFSYFHSIMGFYFGYLNIPKYSVMGWSAGGGASMLLAAQHPDKIKKTVIWCTSSFIHQEDLETYQKIKEISTWGEHIRQIMIETYGEEEFRRMWKKWIDNMMPVLEVEPDVCSDQLKNITCPTFILSGQKDNLVHRVHFPLLCYHIKNSKYFSYPEGKHDIHMKYADDFNHRVQEFLLEE